MEKKLDLLRVVRRKKNGIGLYVHNCTIQLSMYLNQKKKPKYHDAVDHDGGGFFSEMFILSVYNNQNTVDFFFGFFKVMTAIQFLISKKI